MENQNNQNDKPADGYVQAPQQEAKSVLAELAEFVSRKKVAEQNVAAPAVEAKQDAQQNAEKERNTAGTGNEAGGAPVNDGAKEEKSERPARNNRSRGPRRPRTAAPKRAEGAESSENEKTQEERKPKTPRGTRSTAARAEKTEKPARTERAVRGEKAEKPANAERADRAERSAKNEKPARTSKAKNVLADTNSKPKVRIIPLGGLEQIGMNITAFEYEDTIVVVDCGLAFPTDDMLGIDLVIPDVSGAQYRQGQGLRDHPRT